MLLEYIKDILLDTPLNIYSEEENYYTESTYELVHPRNVDNELSREVGTANLYIAACLVCEEYCNGFSVEALQSEEFTTQWNNILNSLIEQKFIRETQLTAHNKIKLVVDNT